MSAPLSPLPTAQALPAEVAVTLLRLPSWIGLGTSFHALPFQCAITFSGVIKKSKSVPTAQALLAEVTATPKKVAPPGTGFGLAIRLQVPPFQWLITLMLVPALCPLAPPTAHALLAEVAATPITPPAPAGLCTTRHALPFQCSARPLPVVGLPLKPTAQALLAEVAATPSRLPTLTGLGATRHALPFQCSIAVLSPLGPPMPTAQALAADVAATPARFPMSGHRTRRQDLPFHPRSSEWPFCSPTAQALAVDVAATPLRVSPERAGFGLGTCRHVLPFQCTISVRRTVPD